MSTNFVKKQKRKRAIRKLIFGAFVLALIAFGCFFTREDFSTGERVGYVTKFSYSGIVFRTHEGELNMSQTGFNSSGAPFQFSIDWSDKRKSNSKVVRQLKEALARGIKVKLKYHQCYGRNLFSHRGSTNYFIDEVTFEE